MKKSKLIIPALGILLLSTAASVSGTVAWFTANRTFTMEVGDFAVVNTKDNLECEVTPGIGTYLDGSTLKVGPKAAEIIAEWADESARTTAVSSLTAEDAGKVYYQTDTEKYYICTGAGAVSAALETPYALTDASFDHTDTNQASLIVPDDSGKYVDKAVNITTATISTDGIKRDTDAVKGNIYSAFTWDLTFKVLFSASASKHIGLYLDTSGADNSWMKKSDGTALGSADSDTGYGFRIAFVPKTIPASSLGVTRVWADNQTLANCHFVDAIAPEVSTWANDSARETAVAALVAGDIGKLFQQTDTSKYYYCDAAAHVVGPLDQPYAPLVNGNGSDFGSSTYAAQLVNATRSASTTTSANALSCSNSKDAAGVPAAGTDSTTTLLTSATTFGLGYFAPDPGNEVSLTFTCVAYYEGTDPTVVNSADTIYQVMKTKMTFGISTLSD